MNEKEWDRDIEKARYEYVEQSDGNGFLVELSEEEEEEEK